MRLSINREVIIAFRHVVHDEQPVLVGHALGDILQRIITRQADMGARQMRPVAVVGVVCVVVGHIHHNPGRGVGGDHQLVRDGHAVAVGAVDDEVAAVLGQAHIRAG